MNTQEELCSICLEEIENGHGKAHLRCGHNFHLHCIGSHFNHQGGLMRCPNCRDVQVNTVWHLPTPTHSPASLRSSEDNSPRHFAPSTAGAPTTFSGGTSRNGGAPVQSTDRDRRIVSQLSAWQFLRPSPTRRWLARGRSRPLEIGFMDFYFSLVFTYYCNL